MTPRDTEIVLADVIWSNTVSGLRIGLVIGSHTPSQLNLHLCFSNTAETRQRIYLIDNAFFRSFQSYFVGTTESGEPLMLTPPSPGHGYVVGAKDFPLLEPDSVQCFGETLTLTDVDRQSLTRLSWTYRNELQRWQGGVPTVDGATRHLFDEHDYPDLWVGELELEVSLVR